MKFTVQTALIALLAFALGLYLPWWSIAMAAFLVCAFILTGPGSSFLSGLLAGTLLWGGLAFLRSLQNGHILAKRFSPLVLGMEEPLLLIGATALIGGLVAGMGALTGSLFRNAINPPPVTEP